MRSVTYCPVNQRYLVTIPGKVPIYVACPKLAETLIKVVK